MSEKREKEPSIEGKWTLFRDTNWVDAQEQFGEEFNLVEAVKMEAEARIDAKKRGLQTTVSPDNGYHVQFDDWDSEKAKLYEALVLKWMEKGEK